MAASGVHREVAAAGRPEAGGRGGGGPGRVGLPACPRRLRPYRAGPRPRLLVRLEACWFAPGAGPAAPFLPGPTCWEEPGRGRRRASLGAPGFASPLSVETQASAGLDLGPHMAGATGSGEVRSLRNRIRRLAWVFFGGRTDGRTDGQTRERAVYKQSAYVEFYVSWARACPDFKFINTARSSQCCVRCW